jgi:hypothetical protein
MDSRNVVLAVLILAIAAGVFYMIDPTLGGLLREQKQEGYENVIYTNAAPSMNGMAANTFPNAGMNDHNEIMENEHNVTEENTTISPLSPNASSNGTMASEGFENPSPMPFASAEKPANCYPKNQLAPQELLPNDPNSKWAQVNPQGAGDIAGKNFLNAGALIGVNTIGQSLRNASWDLRSEPPNPQVQVSPWSQSTIEPDLVRRPLEIQ